MTTRINMQLPRPADRYSRFRTSQTNALLERRFTQVGYELTRLEDVKADEQWVADNFSVAIYGGLRLGAAQTGPDIGAGWVTMPLDTDIIAVPRGVTTDPVGGTITFLAEGVYQMNLAFTIEHNNLNAGRTSELRLFNVTDATPTGSVPWFAGRNTDGTNIVLTTPIEIGAAGLGDPYRVEIGNGDSFTSVIWQTTQFSVLPAGEFRGALP